MLIVYKILSIDCMYPVYIDRPLVYNDVSNRSGDGRHDHCILYLIPLYREAQCEAASSRRGRIWEGFEEEVGVIDRKSRA